MMGVGQTNGRSAKELWGIYGIEARGWSGEIQRHEGGKRVAKGGAYPGTMKMRLRKGRLCAQKKESYCKRSVEERRRGHRSLLRGEGRRQRV